MVILVTYKDKKIGKKIIVRLDGDHLYGKLLFTWLSLVMSLMVSFCVVLYPRYNLDEIWDLIGFSYLFYSNNKASFRQEIITCMDGLLNLRCLGTYICMFYLTFFTKDTSFFF